VAFLLHGDYQRALDFLHLDLGYAGQADAALNLLRQAVADGYCSYPAIDSDPMLASVRPIAEFAQIRAMAKHCKEDFVSAASLTPH
jgi:hypothetical protein